MPPGSTASAGDAMSTARDKAKTSAEGEPRPQKYGRYILVDRLGAGGMAEVFSAWWW